MLVEVGERDTSADIRNSKYVPYVNQNLLQHMSTLEYYGQYEIAKEGDHIEFNEQEEIKDEVKESQCATTIAKELVGDALNITMPIIEGCQQH